MPWDSSIDNEARLRATSVYLVDRVLPMLPEELSNGICSLNPGEDRVSFSVDMTLSKDGAVEEYRIFPSVMRSDRRFTYGQVDSWLSGAEPFPDEQSEHALRGVRAGLGEDRGAPSRPRRAGLRDGRGQGPARRRRHAARGRAQGADRRHELDRRGHDRGQRGRCAPHARRQGADGLPHPRGPRPRGARPDRAGSA